jgi:curli biogenesis system outer membrane secretion channel CsgG
MNPSKYIIVSILSLYFGGCASSTSSVETFDISGYDKKIFEKISIPESCRSEYKNLIPRIAVSDISNNSTFGKADVKESVDDKEIGIGAGASPVFVGIGAKSKNNKYSASRKTDAKLSKTLVSLLESTILEVGGLNLYTREDMYKVDNELKLQDSGMIDEDTLVEIGKTAGVEYIITGSIDNVSQKFRDNSAISKASVQLSKHSDNDNFKLGSMFATIFTTVTDGMKISTKATIKVMKVSTGEILFSKDISDTVDIGKIRNPTFDQIIGAVKVAISNSLPSIKQDLARYISVGGYITQIKENKTGNKIAQINIGSEQNARANQIFRTYRFEEFEDPMSGKKSCDVVSTPIKLLTTNQISKIGTWSKIINDSQKSIQSNKIKLNQLIKRESIKK